MQVEKFGLEALEALCGGTDAVAEVLPMYEVNPPGKAEGLWLRLPSAAHEVRHRNMHEAEATVLEWSPHGDDDRYPALPFLFSAYDLAAFGLAGSGVFLADRLYDGPDIDEAALRQLGRGKEYLRELVRQAHALEQDAYQQQRIEDGRGEDEQPRDADEAARWLRAERERLLAAERVPAASTELPRTESARIGIEPVPAGAAGLPPETPPASAIKTLDTEAQGAQTGPEFVLKKVALVKKYIGQWPTIGADLSSAGENGLAKAAKAGQRNWIEGAALDWARGKGKLNQPQQDANLESAWGMRSGKRRG